MTNVICPITINVPESTYNAVKLKAESQGYPTVEEYLSELLEEDTSFETKITPQISLVLQEGLEDSLAGRVITIEEHNARHKDRRAVWVKSNAK